jgi:hypothetical protein
VVFSHLVITDEGCWNMVLKARSQQISFSEATLISKTY